MQPLNTTTTQRELPIRAKVCTELSLSLLSFSSAVPSHSSIAIAVSFCPPSLSLLTLLLIVVSFHFWSSLTLGHFCSSFVAHPYLLLSAYLSVYLPLLLTHLLTHFLLLALCMVILLIVVHFCLSLQVIGFMSHFPVALCQNKSRIARSMNRCEYVLNKFVGNLIK